MFLLNLPKILKLRKEQLNKQKEYDAKVNLIKKKCPLTIINFLLFERLINRNQQEEYDDSSFTDYISLMYKNLNEINENQKILDNIFNSDDICKYLSIYLNTKTT